MNTVGEFLFAVVFFYHHQRDKKRVIREARIWKDLKHDNIVPLLGLCIGFMETPPAPPGLVSKWMDSDLRTYVTTGDRSFQEILSLVSLEFEAALRF